MNEEQLKQIAVQNKTAWDHLYGATDDLVWGAAPVGFIPEFQNDILSFLKPGSLALDAATGEGRNLAIMLDWRFHVVACDASWQALSKMPEAITGEVARIKSDLYSLPFTNNMFDFVLASDIIETLPQPCKGLQEIHRVLRPGGLFLCNIPGMEDEIAGKDMHELEKNMYLFKENYFYQFLAEGEASKLLTDIGFTIVRQKLCSWTEPAHPQYRDTEHRHTSRVFLVSKA